MMMARHRCVTVDIALVRKPGCCLTTIGVEFHISVRVILEEVCRPNYGSDDIDVPAYEIQQNALCRTGVVYRETCQFVRTPEPHDPPNGAERT